MNHTINEITPNVRQLRVSIGSVRAQSFIDPEYVFTYIKEGHGIYVIEGTEYKISAGDMILMAPYMLHITRSDPGYEMTQCVVHFDLFYNPTRKGIVSCRPEMTFKKFAANRENRETLLADAPMIRTDIPDAVQAQVYRRFEKLRQIFQENQSQYIQLFKRANILEILALYLEQTPATQATTLRAQNWRNIEHALTYIHNHYDESISLDEVSLKAGISVNYFCTLFKQYTGQTIHRYINELGLEKAKRLIEESDQNLTQIADATGLGDIHAFSKIFKKFEKQTPSDYRRQARKRSPHGH